MGCLKMGLALPMRGDDESFAAALTAAARRGPGALRTGDDGAAAPPPCCRLFRSGAAPQGTEGDNRLRKYETATIWKTGISEADLAEEEKKLVDVITSNGGSHSDTEKWGARELAYPIKKETEGTYWFFHWTGDEQGINAIDRYLKLNESCLRFLTLRVGEVDEPVEPPPSEGKTAEKKDEGEGA